ncbi:MAG: hypothetical protein H0U76_19520, partial [Ktedonobacteraceae bacterium]|nr:hypothetical protein [Ktedonobacteraceae bacterium]MBA3826223.1 hypothetical protein [Ktedonobacterales bacterium]
MAANMTVVRNTTVRDEMRALQAPYATIGDFMSSPDFEPWFRHHFRKYSGWLAGFIGGDASTAQDIVQQSFYWLWEVKRDEPLRQDGNLANLLYVHLRYQAMDLIDKRRHPVLGAISLDKTLAVKSELVPLHETLPAFGPGLEEAYLIRETYQEAVQTLHTLPQVQQAILRYYALGFSLREVLQQVQERYPSLKKDRLHYELKQARLKLRGRRIAKKVAHEQFRCKWCHRGIEDGVRHKGFGL